MKPYVLIAALLMCPIAKADDVVVVDSRRNIPLADDEPVYKDFYLNGGAEAGFKKNLVVTAVRRSNIKDTTGAHSYGEIEVPVGQLRILAVYGKVSVAREYKLLSRDENPMLEQTGVMAGDRIETKGSFVDDKPIKRKVAEAETPAPPTPAVAVTASAPAPTPVTATATATVTAPAPAPETAPAAAAEITKAPAPSPPPPAVTVTPPSSSPKAEESHGPVATNETERTTASTAPTEH